MEYQNMMKRRDFLSGTIYGMATLGIRSIMKTPMNMSQRSQNVNHTQRHIVYRLLGKTGIRLPVVSMGVMMTNDPAMIKHAYELGIRHFDTAASYREGRNEEMIGKVLRELGIQDKTVVATKIPRIPPLILKQMRTQQIVDYLMDYFEQSRRRLQFDRLDILYLHDAANAEYVRNAGIQKGLETLKKQRKVRAVGFSTHSRMAESIRAAAEDGFYDVVLTAFNYSMYKNQELLHALKTAASKGIGVIAMKTQCSQPWYKENEAADMQQLYDGAIMHKALLKWVLRHEYITTAIPGVQTFQELEEDFSVANDLEYTSEERRFLEDRNVRLSIASVCQHCHACVPTCTKGVDIPALIRTHMYAFCYTTFDEACYTLKAIPKSKGLDVCIRCQKCVAVCRHRVNIAGRIGDLKTHFGMSFLSDNMSIGIV